MCNFHNPFLQFFMTQYLSGIQNCRKTEINQNIFYKPEPLSIQTIFVPHRKNLTYILVCPCCTIIALGVGFYRKNLFHYLLIYKSNFQPHLLARWNETRRLFLSFFVLSIFDVIEITKKWAKVSSSFFIIFWWSHDSINIRFSCQF